MGTKHGGNIPAHPLALELGFRDRMDEYLGNRLYDQLGQNLEKRGVTDYLNKLGTPETPWEAFRDVMGTVVNAFAIPLPIAEGNPGPQLANVVVTCADYQGLKRFQEFYRKILAGIPSPNNPQIDELAGEWNTLVLRNFSYADVCTAGRIGTYLMQQQFGPLLGQNDRLIQGRTLRQVYDKGFMPYLNNPRLELIKLHDHIEHLMDTLPPEQARRVLVSSGRLSLIGMAFRDVTDESQWAIQRPNGTWPGVEQGIPFRLITTQDVGGEATGGSEADEEAIPLSGTSFSTRLVAQTGEFAKDYNVKKDRGAFLRLGALAVEGGFSEDVAIFILKLLWTAISAPGAAAIDKLADSHTKSQLKGMGLLLPPEQGNNPKSLL